MSLFCLVHGSTQNASGWARLVPELQRRGHRSICVEPTYRRTGSERSPVRASDCGGVAKFYRGSHRRDALREWSVLAAAPCVLLGIEDGVSCRLRSTNRQEPDGAATSKSRNVLAGLDRQRPYKR